MDWTLSRLAAALGLRLTGEDRAVTGMNTLEDAGPDEVSFFANPKYARQLPQTKACAVIIAEEYAAAVPGRALVSANPYGDFGRAVALFSSPQGSFSGISGQAFIHPDAEVDDTCAVYPFAYIGARARIGKGTSIFPGCYVGEDCVIGAECLVYPHAVLMAGTVLGDRCIIHAGAVLGADGFGFSRQDGVIRKIPQIGAVHVGNDVEVGANTTIDRAVLGATQVGEGTKIDNLVQLGHNVRVGKGCLVVSQVGVSGSTRIGDHATLAGQVGIAGHLAIGNNVTIGPQSGVAKDIPDGMTCGGSPCVDGRTFMRTLAVMPRLPDMYKRIGKLEAELDALQQLLAGERQ